MRLHRAHKFHIASFMPMLLVVLVLVIFVFAANEVGDTQSRQEGEILQKALDRSITECYALEGAYPANLNYLMEHYGLVYDSEAYFIDYQYIGSNLRPTVTIIERK